MTDGGARNNLARVVERLAELDERRAELVAERDRLIVRAFSEGVTWRDVQHITGLTPGAVKKSVGRYKASVDN